MKNGVKLAVVVAVGLALLFLLLPVLGFVLKLSFGILGLAAVFIKLVVAVVVILFLVGLIRRVLRV